MRENDNQRNSKTTKTSLSKYTLVLTTIALTASLAMPNVNAVEFSSVIGSQGSDPGEFSGTLPGMAMSNSGNLYVSEKHLSFGPDEIHVFNTDGTFLFKFGSSGSDDGQFREPAGLDFDGSDRLYVADRENDRIQVFAADGTYLFQFGNDPGSMDGVLQAPSDVAISNSDLVYVIDTENNRVQVFDLNGNFQFKFGSPGSDDGEFNIPSAITIDDNANRVIVTDGNNPHVHVFDLNGNFQFKFGSPGSDDGEFMGAPRYTAVDSESNFYASDKGNNRVQIFDSEGNYMDQFGIFGTSPGEFDNPGSIKIENSKLYIVDHGNFRVQIFNVPISAEEIIVNQTTCEDLFDGNWKSTTCRVTDYVNDDKITIPDGITLKIIGKFENKGSIVVDNGATLLVNGWGVYSNGKLVNSGVVVNNGTTQCARCGLINTNLVINSGLIINDWKINNYENFYNFGTIENSGNLLNKGFFGTCNDNFIGNPIERNPTVEIC